MECCFRQLSCPSIISRNITSIAYNHHIDIYHLVNIKHTSTCCVRVTTQDFALLDFKEQVALSHSAGVFISMHGAGTTHIFHSAIGKPNCCALIELFPDKTLEFYTAQGYGNLARMLGLHHWRHVSSDRSTTDEGTIVDVDIITEQVKLAVDKVKKKPTCLNDVKDTSGRIFNEEF